MRSHEDCIAIVEAANGLTDTADRLNGLLARARWTTDAHGVRRTTLLADMSAAERDVVRLRGEVETLRATIEAVTRLVGAPCSEAAARAILAVEAVRS